MRKFLLGFIFLISTVTVCAQTYNNEWINFAQTYYKCKVGSNGLYRITQPSLSSIGLATTPAQQFQLWRNGKEIALYTSIPTGIFGISDYIEFYGQANDGQADKQLYKYDSLQMSDKLSLVTDTAAYFLTVKNGSNKRFTNITNNVAGNILPPETGFIYSLQRSYKVKQNPGFSVDYGSLLYSSSYETGEGWSSADVYPGSIIDNNSIYLDNTGVSASLDAVVSGNASANRYVKVKINGITLVDTVLNGFNIKRFHITDIPLSIFTGGNANIEFVNSGNGADKIVVSDYQLSYPHIFNFEGKSQFGFDLPAGASKYLVINNFNFGTTAPVLLDLTNDQRLTGDIFGSTVRFVIPALAANSSFILLNSEPANIKTVQNFTQRIFKDYSLPANQGNYVIISHPLLFNDGAGNNNVDKYRIYRNSVAGGSFNAIVADINELTDQFAFGIKHHPAAVRNFGYYALDNFSTAPQYFYLIGKGLTYPDFKKYESDPNIDKLALVPTFGYPASDNLLLAARTGSSSLINMGRLSAISGVEVGDYLDKVKQFEAIQNSVPQTNADKGWMKNIAQITGAIDDPSLANLINYFMGGYGQIMADTSFGAKVYSFSKNSGQYTAAGSKKTIDDLFSEGMSYITYFGHSSPNTLEFNLDNPQNYSNTGKYPLIMVNGCNSGNLFLFDTLRAVNKGTLSEKYIFATNKGSIGFIADTHFGLPQQLDFFTEEFDRNLASKMYGQSIGSIMKGTMEFLTANFTNDFGMRIHTEEITFHGDPAIKLNPFTKPDYTIEDSLVTTDPLVISVADEKVVITAKILNIGKAINDSIDILIQHQFPDNSIKVLDTRRIKATLYEDTIQVPVMINPLLDKGLNKIIVTIDQGNEVSELSETNNTVTKNFMVIGDEIRPVFPYDYSIVNNGPGLEIYGSTADIFSGEKQYVMQMDTTRLFNSAFKVTRTVTDSGGVIKFLPGVSLTDSTVYYWRLAVGPVNASTRWLGSSFTYINGTVDDGYGQAHYFQYTDDGFESMNIDSTSRKFNFDNKIRKLLIRTGLYPYYSWDQINVNVDNDQLDLYGCNYNSLQFIVYNPLTLAPWKNYNVSSGVGRFNSANVCANGSITTRAFFEYPFGASTYRASAMSFIDSIPNGYIVSISNLGRTNNTTFINAWKADTATLGSGKSLWHKFHELGLHHIDQFTSNLPFLFLFKKGDTINFPIRQHVGTAVNEQIVDTFLLSGKAVNGSITSPWYGPVKNWKDLKWDSLNVSSTGTKEHSFEITGKDLNGNEMYLGTVYNSKDTTLSYISAAVYPKLQIKMNNTDDQNASPSQLKYWMITSDNYPEGALSPNLFFQCADTLTTADSIELKVAFKNISHVAFDSIKVRLTITGANGAPVVFDNLANGARIKPLISDDTAIISYSIPLTNFEGSNQLKLEVNPDNDQPEQFYFNNILYKNIYAIKPACPGSDISFTVTPFSGTMQWQVNTGSGYTNISDGSLYSGVTTSILVISNAQSNMYGYRYRCLFTGNNTATSSQEFVLKYTALWAGSVSTAWEDPGNWECGILPDANTDVIIKSGVANYPVINSNAVCRSLSATTQTSILIKSGFKLLIAGE
ncbi:MAG: C25 family cysteine peptidase [Ferruginibacter sp.]